MRQGQHVQSVAVQAELRRLSAAYATPLHLKTGSSKHAKVHRDSGLAKQGIQMQSLGTFLEYEVGKAPGVALR